MTNPLKFDTGRGNPAKTTFLDTLRADKIFLRDVSEILSILLVSMLTVVVFAWTDWAHSITDLNFGRFIGFMILASSLTSIAGLIALALRLADEWLWYEVEQFENTPPSANDE